MSYTQLSDSSPVARKQHRCTWCGQAIPKGEKYVRVSGIFDSELQVNKFHSECDEACREEAHHWGGDFEFIPGDNERPTRIETTA